MGIKILYNNNNISSLMFKVRAFSVTFSFIFELRLCQQILRALHPKMFYINNLYVLFMDIHIFFSKIQYFDLACPGLRQV